MSSIVCGCGKTVETQPEWAGQWIACPSCAGSLYAPFPGPKPSTPTVASEPTKLCPLCSETIAVSDPDCRYCGGAPKPAAVRPAPAPAANDGGVAPLVVSLLGYMFCGLLCPIGWMLAVHYESSCRRQGIEPSGTGKAAKIIGIIGTVFLILSIGTFILMAGGA